MRIGSALKAEIEATFEMVPSRSTTVELCFVCPEPSCGDKSGNRSVNLINGHTNCWRCNKGGNFLSWARHLGYRFSSSAEEVALRPTLEIEAPKKTLLPVIQPVKLPEGFIRVADQPNSVYARYIGEMAERKNLSFDVLSDAGVGFTRLDPRWEPYAIFPVTEYNTVVYWQGRTYIDDPEKGTKLFPSRGEVQYGARYWVYNIDEARAYRPEIIIVVESILNVLSLRCKLYELGWLGTVVPVCVFKHKVSAEQVIKISRIAGLKEVCLMFDHDATKRAWESAASLTHRVRLSVAEMPCGEGNTKLDPNDDVEAAIQVFEQRQAYTVGQALVRKLALTKPVSVPMAGVRIYGS